MSASHTPTTSIPLTTTFTPSPSCLSDYYWIGSFISLGPPSTTACLPSGWQLTSQHFSPGQCPSGYVIACSTSIALGSLTETQATCCPSSYSCQTGDNWPWFSTEPCARSFDAFPIASTLSITTMVNGVATVSNSVLTYGGVNAYGISIRWQSTDFAITVTHPITTTLTSVITSTIISNETTSHSLTPSAAAGSVIANETTSHSLTPSAVAGSGIANETTSHSLTPSAVAGIGVSVTLIFVAIIAVVTLFILRHCQCSISRRRSSVKDPMAQSELPREMGTQMIIMDGGMVYRAE
jgi:hypothetical protein